MRQNECHVIDKPVAGS